MRSITRASSAFSRKRCCAGSSSSSTSRLSAPDSPEALLQLLELALADVRALRRPGAMLDDRADRLDAGRPRELLDLGELVVGVRTLSQHREDEPALGLRGTWNHRSRLCPLDLDSDLAQRTLELVDIPSASRRGGGAVQLRHGRRRRSSTSFADGESLLYAKRTRQAARPARRPHRHRAGPGEPARPDRGRLRSSASARPT